MEVSTNFLVEPVKTCNLLSFMETTSFDLPCIVDADFTALLKLLLRFLCKGLFTLQWLVCYDNLSLSLSIWCPDPKHTLHVLLILEKTSCWLRFIEFLFFIMNSLHLAFNIFYKCIYFRRCLVSCLMFQ